MTIGSLLFAAALLFLAGVFIGKPFLFPQKQSAIVSERAQLVKHKEALLADIQALEFDFESGKLPEGAYQQERLVLVEETADILQQLDQIATTDNRDKAIETAILQLRNANKVPCPHCDKKIEKESNFCAFCGEAI